MSELEGARVAWYVVHTYSGYENKVKANLEKTVENRGLQDMIVEVKVPVEKIIEVGTGKKAKKPKEQKIFPGYVMVKMVMNDETWYIVRNTRGVTGFVGPGSKPIPLTEEEVRSMNAERTPIHVGYTVGEHIRVLSGPLENFEGVIEEVLADQQKLRVVVSMFGRDTPVELDFGEVERL